MGQVRSDQGRFNAPLTGAHTFAGTSMRIAQRTMFRFWTETSDPKRDTRPSGTYHGRHWYLIGATATREVLVESQVIEAVGWLNYIKFPSNVQLAC